MRRQTLVLLMLAAVLVSSSATWFASEQIRSPAEAAARTAAPNPSPILVPVRKQVLQTRVVTRGTAHFGSPQDLAVASSGLKTGPQVVTTLPSTGTRVSTGDVLLTISGRPVFLLEGAQPSYRDLGPGIQGADVRQLEMALRRAGLDPGMVDGLYDNGTALAVTKLYRRHGAEPMVATGTDLANARPLEAELVAGARAEGGVQLPADEVVFVPDTPLRVTELRADVGDAPTGALVTVTDSVVVIDGLLPVERAGLVEEGARVVIDEPALGISATGRVKRVADRAGTEGADGFHVFFEIDVHRPPAALVGTSVRLTIPVRSTRTAQLTVPLSAVSQGPDGGSRVEVAQDGSRSTFVPVRPGLSADGYVTVTPPEGGLSAGDRVVIGFQRGGPGSG